MAGRPSRKLAVMLHADVVGSTALVQRDESLAHERIRGAFQRLSGTIESYNGHPLELRGDALLAEFSRASDAVEASLAFQAENTRFNSTLEDEIQPTLRIGISLGEVVVADNTVTVSSSWLRVGGGAFRGRSMRRCRVGCRLNTRASASSS